MFCETYNRSLKDAAAAGTELSSALRHHLASCAACRTSFAEEQTLFAAIDTGLRAVANSEVPATLIPRVHVSINNEPVRQPDFSKWIFAGALFTSAFIAALVFEMRHRESPNYDRATTAQSPSTYSSRSTELTAQELVAVQPPAPKLKKVEATLAISFNRSTSLAAEVLVPDEERAAFAKFLSHEQSLPLPSSAATLIVADAPKELVPIPAVEVANLKLAPLSGEDGERNDF